MDTERSKDSAVGSSISRGRNKIQTEPATPGQWDLNLAC